MKFAPDPTMECLYTKVRNLAATERFYGFLPKHGKRLAAGEEIVIFGDLRGYFSGRNGDRKRRACEAALKAQDLVIAKSPAALLYDDTLDETKALSLDNSSFAAIDPCFGAYSSSL